MTKDHGGPSLPMKQVFCVAAGGSLSQGLMPWHNGVLVNPALPRVADVSMDTAGKTLFQQHDARNLI